MNQQYILDLVKNSLNNEGNLDVDKFDRYFGALDDDDKDQIEFILEENDIVIAYDSAVEKVIKPINLKPLPKDKNINLTNEQLCVLFQQGNNDALTLLVMKNQRLIYSRVMKLNNRYKHKLDIDDLFQSGFIGLLIAAKKFDNSLGFKFTTYAINWIDQRILRDMMDHGFTIRIPVHLFEKINKMLALSNKNFTLNDIEIRELIKEKLNYDDETISFLQVISKNILSLTALSTPIGEDGDTSLGDMIVDKTTPTVEDDIEMLFLREEINTALENLKEREQDVIKLRFGLDGNEPHTLEEIGIKQGVTRERIRQIEAKALRRLRASKKTKHLRGYLINE